MRRRPFAVQRAGPAVPGGRGLRQPLRGAVPGRAVRGEALQRGRGLLPGGAGVSGMREQGGKMPE